MKNRFVLLSTLAILVVACSLPFNLIWANESSDQEIEEKSPLVELLQIKPTRTPTPTAPVRIEEADQALFSGDLDRAQLLFQQAFDQSQNDESKAQALFGIGRCLFTRREYNSAIDAFNRILGQYQNTDILAKTYFMIGESYFKVGNFQQAANAYEKYAQSAQSILKDTAFRLQGDSALTGGDYNQAILAYQNAIQANPTSRSDYLNLQIGKAYEGLENFTTAIQYYTSVYDTSQDDLTKSTANLLAGQALKKLGRDEEASARFLDSVIQFPRAFDSFTALTILVADKVEVNEFQRGLVNYYARSYDAAINAFERYLNSEPEDNDGSVHYFKGLSHFFRGDYGEAIAEYDLLITNFPGNTYWAAAWDEKAHVLWVNLNRPSQAVETYLNFVAASPTAAEAAAYLFEAGRVSERAGDLEGAAQIWQRMMDEYPSAELSYRGLFLSGISYYRLNRYTEALSIFQRALVLGTTPKEKAKAYVWLGKCQQMLEKPDEANSMWEMGSLSDPTSYYSIRANELMENKEPFSVEPNYDFGYDLDLERPEAERWMRTTFNLPDEVNLQDLSELTTNPRLNRIQSLWEVGRYMEAVNEADQLRAEYQNDVINSYRLMNFLLELHLYQPAIYLARNIINNAGLDDLSSLSAPIFFTHVRFGAYFRDLVVPISNDYGINPLIFYALIRQESMFNPYISSPAGASGLAQIMPATAKENVDLLKWPSDFENSDLVLGKINLTLGAFYLNRMNRYFSGNLQAALAAYNAGPGNSEAWLGLAGGDPDLLLEVIRFQETQNYLMQITEFLNIYKLVYTRQQ